HQIPAAGWTDRRTIDLAPVFHGARLSAPGRDNSASLRPFPARTLAGSIGAGMREPKRDPRGLPIGPGHVLYPILATFALTGILFGSIGQHLTEDMPESKTPPYFPDHIWPYPILAVVLLTTLALL